MTVFELLSLMVSLVAAAIALLALHRNKRTTDRQLELESVQAALAEKQLRLIQAQETVSRTAQIDVELVGHGVDKNFYICNEGQGVAFDVNVEFDHSPPLHGREPGNKLPIDRLKSGRQVELRASFSMGKPTKYRALATWVNEDRSPGEEEFELHR